MKRYMAPNGHHIDFEDDKAALAESMLKREGFVEVDVEPTKKQKKPELPVAPPA